MKYIDKR